MKSEKIQEGETMQTKTQLTSEDKAQYISKIAKIGLERHDARMLYKEIVDRTGSVNEADNVWIAARKMGDGICPVCGFTRVHHYDWFCNGFEG